MLDIIKSMHENVRSRVKYNNTLFYLCLEIELSHC